MSRDIHLRNVQVKLSPNFNKLSHEQFIEKFGEPKTVPIRRVDGKLLTPNIPFDAVQPQYLGKKAQDFTLVDVRGLILCDFGEAFNPSTEQKLGMECHAPLATRAPEALFEPTVSLSFPADIWSLGTALWELLGMKFIFSEHETKDELVAQQLDVLGAENFPTQWRKHWERPSMEMDGNLRRVPRKPAANQREKWPLLEEAFDESIQAYRRKISVAGMFEREETRAILDLMRHMLKFRPTERLTIDEVLNSEWMRKWALPELNNSLHDEKGGN